MSLRASGSSFPADDVAHHAAPPAPVEQLGPWSGTYHPDYSLRIYQNGDPSHPLTGVNLRSVTRISTSKNLDNIAGQFTINLKDRRAQGLVKPMDVVEIRLKGHNQGWGTVLRGVVDGVEPDGSAQVSSSQADVTISGRCAAKYLQVNSLFLPAWDPQANLPTALIFGTGDSSNKLGTNVNAYSPRAIFGYIFDHYVVGLRNRVGLSGTPNARFWLSRSNRFEWVRDGSGKVFQVPFVQFDEDTCDQALTRLTVQGFTEGWVDEVGNIVYRRPQWDAPISWVVHTSGLKDWSLPESDDAMATYVEVYPGALPGIASGAAQALLAGRAPLPSDYVTGLQSAGFQSPASSEFIIDTDSSGKVTANGLKNWYYQKQKTYGLRPYMITSPLLASRQQAQAQAEGLLRFMLRWDKSGQLEIPGEPNVRLGQTLYLHGPLDDQNIARTYYVQGVQQEYAEGDHYSTTLMLTHGRDPGDPSWQQMVLPNFNPSQLANLLGGGLLSKPGSGPGFTSGPGPAGGGGGGGSVGTPTGSFGGLSSPFTKKYSATGANVDMGVDFGRQQGIATGDSILAIGDCYLRRVDPAWYAGQPTMFFELVDKSAGYWGWYVGEEINMSVSVGSSLIRAGTSVATYASSGTGIEIGFAASSTQTQSQADGDAGSRHSGGGTKAGNAFLQFLQHVGAA